MSEKKKVFVPNVVAKNNPKEMARLQSQIGNMRQQNGQFLLDETDQERVVESRGEDLVDGQIDLKNTPSVYICGCKNSTYTINHRTAKILIESCENVTVILNGKVLTSTVEVWKCKGVTLKTAEKIKTLQCDIMTGMKVQYKSKADFQCIVWQDVDKIDVSFLDEPKLNLNTGFAHMLEKYPDSDIKIDQFIIRFVPSLGPGVQPERCVRLKNGHLSTEREAADWDRRNGLAKEKFKEDFCKEHSIRVNKVVGKKIPPNSKCACGSGKKYKKCCSGKQELSGLHDSQKAKTFQSNKEGTVVETKTS